MTSKDLGATTALLFPTGGYQWPGMGADLDASEHREVLDRVDAALRPLGVTGGSLRRLMAGENQARRQREDGVWTWAGDFPLSMVAQMALGTALGREFVRRHGPPGAVAGESMGELCAYALSGALSLEDAGVLTWRWARDLEEASARLRLRMAVVEDLDEPVRERLLPALEANPVVFEAPRLIVAALSAERLDDLDREVTTAGGHTLVSNNPCAAHEPRLAEVPEIWSAHERFLASLAFHKPELTVPSTLDPERLLEDVPDLIRNRRETTVRPVRWGETVARLPERGIRRLVLFGPASAGYALKKLRASEERLSGMRLNVVSTLEGVRALTTGRR